MVSARARVANEKERGHESCAASRREGGGDKPSGEEEESGGGDGNADGRDHARAEAGGQPVAHEAGEYGSKPYDDGNNARPALGHAELLAHDGPRRAEQRVGQAETYETYVDDGDKQGDQAHVLLGK